MELLIKDPLCKTTDEYIMEMENCVEQIRIIAEEITNANTSISQKECSRVEAFGSTLVILCRYFNAIVQDYHYHKAMDARD